MDWSIQWPVRHSNICIYFHPRIDILTSGHIHIALDIVQHRLFFWRISAYITNCESKVRLVIGVTVAVCHTYQIATDM